MYSRKTYSSNSGRAWYDRFLTNNAQRLSTRVLFFILFTFGVRIQQVDTTEDSSQNIVRTCDPLSEAFLLCASDSQCTYRFGIDVNEDDVASFRFQYEHCVLGRFALDANLLQRLLCPEIVSSSLLTSLDQDNNVDVDSSSASRSSARAIEIAMFLAILRDCNYCDEENLFFDVEAGCSCRSGKVCSALSAADYTPSVVQHDVVGITLLIGIVFMFVWSTVQLSRLRAQLAHILHRVEQAEGENSRNVLERTNSSVSSIGQESRLLPENGRTPANVSHQRLIDMKI